MDVLYLSLLILAACSIHYTHALPTRDCTNKPADVVFILDSSNSIWINDFYKQLQFVNDVIKMFDIGPRAAQTRVGVLTFGHEVWRQFYLNDKMDEKDLMDSVTAIQHGRGKMTNTADAIHYAVDNMFTPRAGSRPGVTHVAIVITDGRSQKTMETKLAAEKAHKADITMFAIGVGRRLDYNELSAIASEPDVDFLFLVDDYNALSSITHKLALKTCEVTTAPIPVTTPVPVTTEMTPKEPNCGGKPAEIVFVIDASGSILRKEFNKELQFVKNIIQVFDMANDKTRVGIISFSNDAKVLLPLDNGLDKWSLIHRVGNIDHIAGGTNTADALKVLRQNGFDTNVVRPGVAKIAILLTDGLSVDEGLTKREAKLTHLAGIKVFAIGIGTGVDMVEIRTIASDPNDDYVFRVDDFNALDSIKDKLAIKTCDVKPDEIKENPHDEPICLVRKDTDLMFIYDTTALGEKKSQQISRFLSAIISQFDTKSGNLRVGRLTDNCPSGGNFILSNNLSPADFQEIGLPIFSNLIKKVRRTGFTSEYGGRDDATNIGVIFIDSDMAGLDHNALHEATKLSNNTEVFLIAIGQSPMVRTFTNSFKEKNVVRIRSYNDLSLAATEILNKLCYFYELDFFNYDIDYVVPA